MDAKQQYADMQKQFWDVDTLQEAMYERVCTLRDAVGVATDDVWRSDAEMSLGRVLAGVKGASDWTILEIGCGVGRLIDLVRARIQFQRIIGLDISEKMIRFAHQYLGDDPRVELHVNDGMSLAPLEDESIHFAYAVDVFIHIYDVDTMLNYLLEIKRVCRSGARFCFNARYFDPKKAFGNTWGGRLARALFKLGVYSTGRHRWLPGQPGGLNGNQYTSREMRKLIGRSGLKLVALESVDSQVVGNKLWVHLEKQ